MKLGTRIRQLREVRGFSQQVVAEHLGMEQPNYHKLESDKSNISLTHLEKLADLYKISLVELIAPERGIMHIENNNHIENGVVMSDPELVQNLLNAKDELLKSKDELLKLKDEKIAWLEKRMDNNT
jgi:transcriptional regulator with XRE-family HTH domain